MLFLVFPLWDDPDNSDDECGALLSMNINRQGCTHHRHHHLLPVAILPSTPAVCPSPPTRDVGRLFSSTTPAARLFPPMRDHDDTAPTADEDAGHLG
ncbi:hypothetical protein BJ912DRAFT_1064390 [Pholiota molesta]|nr:hypothetical protein BJ912DRAFT_1064390 [Pholiota molesta]